MSLTLTFHPEVDSEVDAAYGWYERQRAGLGEDFLAALDEVLLQINSFPQVHPVLYRNVRRAAPRRFPYGVFYRVQSDRIEILAVLHSRQSDRRWRSRL